MKLSDEQYIAAIEGWPIMAQWGRKSVEALAEVLAHRQPAQPEAQPKMCDAVFFVADMRFVCELLKGHAGKHKSLSGTEEICEVEMIQKYAGWVKYESIEELLDERDKQWEQAVSDAYLWRGNNPPLSEFLASVRAYLSAKPPQQETREQQVTAILQETVKETNEKWELAAEKIARVREGK